MKYVELPSKSKAPARTIHPGIRAVSPAHSTTDCSIIAPTSESTLVKLVMYENDNRPGSALKERIVECRYTPMDGHETFGCTECGKAFTCKDSIDSHIRTKHKPIAASESVAAPSLQKKPIDYEKTIGGYNCLICKNKFRFLYSMLNHLSVPHPETTLEPNKLPGQFHLHENAKESHYDSQSRDCSGKREYDLKRLVMNKYTEEEYACRLCHKKIRLAEDLRNHYRSQHVIQQKFSCNNCNLFFAFDSDRRYHESGCLQYRDKQIASSSAKKSKAE